MDDLTRGIVALKGRGISTFPANVVSVNKETGTCVVNDGDLDYTDVQLSAIIDAEKKQIFLYPVIGSSVLISPINEDIHRLYIEVYSEIEALDLKIEGVNLNIDKDGFLLKKENETLKKLMVDLISEIRKMKFTTNTGSTIKLINEPQLLNIENRFKDFLK
ncbi:hypothetical protein CMT52_07870 [Elizabethkingia anophelis]|nr:hypothetical protein [Elizabethkingia anophelis]